MMQLMLLNFKTGFSFSKYCRLSRRSNAKWYLADQL